MKAKASQLIRLLINDQPTTSSTLAKNLGVSVRSIKNYVREINQENEGLITSSRNGYEINIQKAYQVLNDNINHIPQTSDDRVVFIINKLLHHHNDENEVNMYDLCETLYVSLSTLKIDLNKIKRKLKPFDLELIIRNDNIMVNGLEKNKRKVLSTILYDESNVNFVNFQSLQKAFIDIDIEFIKNTVLDVFGQYHYFINDYSLINLVLHITITVDRIRNNNINNEKVDGLSAVRLHEFQMAHDVAKRLETKFNITFSEAEIYEMTLLIISRATMIDYKSITKNNLEEFIGKDCLKLVNNLIQDINAFYYIDLNEQEFFIRFALHIKNLIVRSKNNYFSKNPLAEGIKTSCPLIYDMSVNLAQTMKEQTGISINDDEIAYIAFHLGSALEAQKSLAEKINAVLYCPNYYDLNLRVTDRINHYFKNDLLITNILTDESEITKLENIDLIITTIPLSSQCQIPVILINLFLNDKDRSQLSNKIIELRKIKKRKEFESYLRELIIPEFFERNDSFGDKSDCIHYMVKKMIKHEYVNKSFESEVLDREQISSTAFGSFAIPHAMKMYAKKTGINVLISDEPINWDQHQVNLVIMMCFNKNERYIFNEIYDPITMILSEAENLKKINDAKNYDDFISTMVNLL